MAVELLASLAPEVETRVVEEVVGVGVLILTADGQYLSIREEKTKRKTNKVAGMISAPMETVETGEGEGQALERLFREEVVAAETNELIFIGRLCDVQLAPGVWLHAYLLLSTKPFKATTGENGQDVAQPTWRPINQVMEENTGIRFRPGVKELVKSYLTFASDPENFTPQIYFECEDKISPEEFDRLEASA